VKDKRNDRKEKRKAMGVRNNICELIESDGFLGTVCVN